MNSNDIVTPCISVCKTDPVSGFCYGCGRNDNDKLLWNDLKTTNEWKKANLKTIRNRLNDWQKVAFDKSYLHKKTTGLSLIKQVSVNLKK